MMQGSSILDEGREFRYSLERTWNSDIDRVLFIMLNPSSAGANVDDATIWRCMSFAARWGKGGIVVGNLFALRSTDPKGLFGHRDPVGPENDGHLERLTGECETVVAGWGDSARFAPEFQKRQACARDLLQDRMQCLGTNKDGTPRHPVRQSRNLGSTLAGSPSARDRRHLPSHFVPAPFVRLPWGCPRPPRYSGVTRDSASCPDSTRRILP